MNGLHALALALRVAQAPAQLQGHLGECSVLGCPPDLGAPVTLTSLLRPPFSPWQLDLLSFLSMSVCLYFS